MNINATLLGQMITFIIFVLITMKYVWPLFKKVLDERAKKIADGLAAAQQGHREKEIAEVKSREVISEARQQAAKIVEQAHSRAHAMIEEAQQQARSEGERLLANARLEIVQARNAAQESLRKSAANLAIAGAERLLQRHINNDDADKMIDELVAEL